MPNDVPLQTVLASSRRSLRTVFAQWLARKELSRPRDEQIILYLAAAQQSMARRRVLAGVSEAARAVLARVTTQPMPVSELLAATAAAGYPVTLATLGELHAVGLAFIDNPDFWPHGGAAFTPETAEQTLSVIPGLQPDELELTPAPAVLAPCSFTSKAKAKTRASLAQLLDGFTHAISRDALKLTQDGVFTARAQDVLTRVWKHAPRGPLAEPARVLAFMREHAIAVCDSAGQVRPGTRFAMFCTQNRAQQVCQFLEYCLAGMPGLADLRAACGYAPERFVLATLRAVLHSAHADSWWAVDAIAAELARRAAKLASVKHSPAQWGWRASTCRMLTRARWTALLNELVQHWLEPAGMLDAARSQRHGMCVRVTPIGAFWLTGAKAPVHKNEHQQLVVQPDFTAVLTHSGPFDRVAQVLSGFAARSGDDNASVFHFTREQVQAAIRHGHRIEELLGVLKAHSSYAVPDNVMVTLREWAAISPQLTLYRDVNVFTFETRAARDQFLRQYAAQHSVAIGDLHAILLAPERDIFNIMQVMRAVPVDYTDPPIGGLEVRPDGEVISSASDDFRITALCEAIAQPADTPLPNGQVHRRYYLSAKRMHTVHDPLALYELLLHLPGKPLPINTRLNLLVGLGIIEATPDDRYAVVQGVEAAVRAKLRTRGELRGAMRAVLIKDIYVVHTPLAAALAEALAALRSRARMSEVHMHRIPVRHAAHA
jgi:hypothetical protein